MFRTFLMFLFIFGIFGCGDSEDITTDSDENVSAGVEANSIFVDSQTQEEESTLSIRDHVVKFAGIEMMGDAGEFQMGSPALYA